MNISSGANEDASEASIRVPRGRSERSERDRAAERVYTKPWWRFFAPKIVQNWPKMGITYATDQKWEFATKGSDEVFLPPNLYIFPADQKWDFASKGSDDVFCPQICTFSQLTKNGKLLLMDLMAIFCPSPQICNFFD